MELKKQLLTLPYTEDAFKLITQKAEDKQINGINAEGKEGRKEGEKKEDLWHYVLSQCLLTIDHYPFAELFHHPTAWALSPLCMMCIHPFAVFLHGCVLVCLRYSLPPSGWENASVLIHEH